MMGDMGAERSCGGGERASTWGGGFTGDVHSVSRSENQCWAGGGGRGPRAWKTSNKGLLRDGAGMWGMAGREGVETGLRHRFVAAGVEGGAAWRVCRAVRGWKK